MGGFNRLAFGFGCLLLLSGELLYLVGRHFGSFAYCISIGNV